MKRNSSYAKNIFNFTMVFMTTYLLNSSASGEHFPQDEDTPFGVSAVRRDIYIEGDLKIPNPEADGKIATLNQTGFMTPDQNPYNLQFIEFAAQCSVPSLEIGAAYGLTSLPALRRGARLVANDIDERHLLLLREQAPQELRANLTLNKRKFPNEMDFPANSLKGILACRVFHFLSEDEMEQGIEKMKHWLIPGGRVFVVTMSPHHRHLKEKFLPLYLKKVKEGNPWPGIIQNMHEYVPHEAEQIPQFVHVMDTDSLGSAFRRHGFTVIQESLFDYTRPGAQANDGKGYYGIVVEKPAVSASTE